MDANAQKDLYWFFVQLWPSMVVALIVYVGGLTTNALASLFFPAAKAYLSGKQAEIDPSWPFLFRLWASTRVSHPFLVGALISLVPELPRPEFAEGEISAAMWFGLVGMLNGQVHMIGESVVRQITRVVGLILPWARTKLGLPASETESDKTDA